MTFKYSPQLKIRMFKLVDGQEKELDFEIIPNDLSSHRENKPVHCSVSIEKSLGATQDTCTITLYNAPVVELIRSNFEAYIPIIQDQVWRVYVWAWWSDGDTKTSPDSSPLFIGDIDQDFSVSPSGITDSTIKFVAKSSSSLMTAGKKGLTIGAGKSYLQVINEIFEYFSELGYKKKIIIQDSDGILSSNKLIKPLVINRNPVETLNDICRHFDFVFGVDSLALYVMRKSEYLKDDLTPETYNNKFIAVADVVGQTSMLGWGKYTFSLSMLYDSELSIGKKLGSIESPTINAFSPAIGRINSISYKLDNYNTMVADVECQFIIDGKVVLPKKRDDSSGRRTT